jgi:dihydrolipoamide dehydrogenase
MEPKGRVFDLIIIGSGPGGYLSAILAFQKGMNVAIVEKGAWGGTCLNRGCIPTKALLKDAFLWDNFARSGWIEKKEDRAGSFRKALEKKDAAVQQVVLGLKNILNRDRITGIEGEASFVNPRNLEVKREGKVVERLESDRIIVAAGAVSEESPLKKDGQGIIGSDDVLKMKDLPSGLAIIGGGRRGVEFAVLFNTFGVKVTLIERTNRILSKMDREISIRYKSLLTKRSIKVLTESEVKEGKTKGKLVSLRVLSKEERKSSSSERVLLVGDRQANLDGLDVEKASLSVKDGFISVDTCMGTSSSGIYAAGDVVGKGFMAHKAFAEARVAVENLLGRKAQMDYRLIPICLYGFPEAASVGLTEEEATAKWKEVKVGKFPFMGCGRSVAAGEQDGMVKIISEPKYGEILGVHILGPGATEMIHLGVMAMKHEIGVEEINQTIFAHPTFSEAF